MTDLFRYLIDNAIRFCPNEVPHVHISVQDRGDVFEFAIRDNGIGIDHVYRDLIFGIFQCLDNESPNRSEGVGLTFSKKIVHNHGGKIYFKSNGRDGTCFNFTLPKH